MENRIPIDELFREKLAEGQEPHNLGAWANMSRMLDGKNPYGDETESKKKRRILPFIGLFLALGGLLTAGIIATQKGKEPKLVQHQINNNQTVNEQNNNVSIAPERAETPNKLVETVSNGISTEEHLVNTQNDNSTNNIVKQPQEKPNQHSTVNKNSVSNNDIASTVVDISSSKQSNDANSIKNNSLDKITSTTKHDRSKNNNNQSTSDDNNVIDVTKQNLVESVVYKPKQKKTKVIKESIFDTLNQVKITQNLVTDRLGEVAIIKNDTSKLPPLIKETIVERLEEINEEPIIASKTIISPEKSNPRLVKLSNEQKLQADYKIELPTLQSKTAAVMASNTDVSPEEAKAPSLTSQINKKHTSYFQDMVEVAKTNIMKVADSKLNPFNGQIHTIPGISAGVNAALFSKDNFGGFHVGLTDLIPINDYLSILSEIKIFFRNNSGFTVNDVQTNVRDKNVDLTTLASQNQVIYSYQTDSSTNKYNFKNFTSLELPIMLHAQRNALSMYGGLNLAYNFGLNVTTLNSNYASPKTDSVILNKLEQFTFPTNKTYQFTRDDFRSRFGLGYAIGGTYSFNPNLYVDLRVSQTLWNNAKTEAAKQISTGVFKVPYFQFSIGYRFKSYTSKRD